MDEQSMGGVGDVRNRLMRTLRAERVVKNDGRYLIYYSWTDEAEQGEQAKARPRRTAGERPQQQPWSPEAGPTDV